MYDPEEAELEEELKRFDQEMELASPRDTVTVIEMWSRGEIGPDVCDEILHERVCDRAEATGDLAALPVPVQHYFTSRYMMWEVANGGFAQAAFNIPELFEPAARAYEAFGQPACAARIREALDLTLRDVKAVTRWRRIRSIGRLFKAFARSDLAQLDDGLEAIGWFDETPRLAYVRTHKQAFAEPGEHSGAPDSPEA